MLRRIGIVLVVSTLAHVALYAARLRRRAAKRLLERARLAGAV